MVLIETRQISQHGAAQLRLMATTDLHMHLTGFDYAAGQIEPSFGLSRVATLIEKARAEVKHGLCLLMDNGDALQGGPMGEIAMQRGDRRHPLMRAFAHLGYDAIGLGNHDFDFGLEALSRTVRDAPCPVICSNMSSLHGSAAPPCLAQEAILARDICLPRDGETRPLKIGVLSFLPPQTMIWNAHFLAGHVEISDIVETARIRVAALRHRGCDLVIVLAHSGVGDTDAEAGMENALIPLSQINGINAIVGGHTHVHFPGSCHSGVTGVDSNAGKIHGAPVIMPGSAGSHLGVIDLFVDLDDTGQWQVSDATCELRPVVTRDATGRVTATIAESQPLTDELAEDHAETIASLERPAGKSDRPLHSYFTFIARDQSLAVVAAAQAAAVRPHLDASWARDLPLLSAASPGKFGARAGPTSFTDVPAGPLLHRHLTDLQIFPNKLRVVLVTGAQILDWLEMSASLFRRIRPGSQGDPLLNPDVPGHEFDVLHGLSYEFDLSIDARFNPDGRLKSRDNHRVMNATHIGQPVGPDQLFVVAVNNFRANGGGHFAALRNAQPVAIPPISIREALRDYLSGTYPRDPLENMPQPWRFRPMPGTCVSILTGPGARAHLDEIADRDYKVLGLDEQGFLRLCVAL